MSRSLDVFIVVGEPSGDQLGFKLMRALREQRKGAVAFRGVAGQAMIAEGMTSLFALEDIAVMGLAQVIRRFPKLYARAWKIIRSILADPPDILVIIDSPDFTHAVAKRVRRRLPHLPIIDYVSPSVWAWRSGRAKKMRAYIDRVLALLPFEPDAYSRLEGPPCFYVGHPLIERLDELRPSPDEAFARDRSKPLILVLPGSRASEISHMMTVFGEAVALAAKRLPSFDLILPTVPWLAERVRANAMTWTIQPRIVEDELCKFTAFRMARAALAASGTVTLELALSGVPMVGAYRGSAFEAFLAKRLVKAPFVLLPNLILGERAIPEFMQEEATADHLAEALVALSQDNSVRQRQIDAFTRLDGLMNLKNKKKPSQEAARLVIETWEMCNAQSPRTT